MRLWEQLFIAGVVLWLIWFCWPTLRRPNHHDLGTISPHHAAAHTIIYYTVYVPHKGLSAIDFLNLATFVELGVKPNQTDIDYQFIISLVGDFEASKASFLATLQEAPFYRKFNANNVNLIWLSNRKTDLCNFVRAMALTSDLVSLRHSQSKRLYFMFINTTVRGPLISPWILSTVRDWWHVFLTNVRGKNWMVGAAMNCEYRAHIQTTAFMLNAVAKDIAQSLWSDVCEYPEDGDKDTLVRRYEIGLSVAIREAGGSVSTLLPPYYDWDVAEMAVCDLPNPYTHHNYVPPYWVEQLATDTIFYKNSGTTGSTHSDWVMAYMDEYTFTLFKHAASQDPDIDLAYYFPTLKGE